MNAEDLGDYRSLLAQYGGSHWWPVGMRRMTWALFESEGKGMLAEGRRVLDVGCGPGWDLSELPAGAQGIGMDRNSGHVFFRPLVLGDAAHLPFPDGTFDLVLALDLLEQRTANPRDTLCEIFRVLRGRGLLTARVPANRWLIGPHDTAWGGTRRFHRDDLSRLLSDTGYTIRRLTHANSILFPFAVAIRLAGRLGWMSGHDLGPTPAVINRIMGGVLGVEAHWLRRRNLPFGLSLLCLAERSES